MSTKINLTNVERRAYMLYHQDGLADIVLGLAMLGFGFYIITGSVATSFLTWMPFIFLWSYKQRITVPRVKFTDLSPERIAATSIRSTLFGIVIGIGLLVTLVAGIALFIAFGNISPVLQSWIKDYGLLSLGVAIVAFMGILGYMWGNSRLYAYAGLTAVAIAATYLFTIPLSITITLLGLVVLLCGVVVLIRFLRSHPLSR